MPLQVNNNTAAFNVFTSYSSNMTQLQQSMKRLSSGVKQIKDDSSGVGISERMRAQIRSTAMARTNVGNGLSLLQTADAWLQNINDMLSRMHELCINANDGTKTAEDKVNIQSEFSALQNEIVRVTSHNTAAAKFNGLYLFRGGNGRAIINGDEVETGSVNVQIGADSGQSFGLTLADLQVTNSTVIGTVSSYTYSTDNTVSSESHQPVTWMSVIDHNQMSVSSADGLGMIIQAINYVSNTRAKLGAQQVRLDLAHSGLLSYEDNLRHAESKIRDIDVARESTEFSRYQILTQLGNAMMAQANQLPSSAVQLLG